MTKKHLLLYLAALGFLFTLPYLRSLLKKSPKPSNQLIVGTNALFAPFEFIQDGTLCGFDIDVIQEIGKRMGKDIIFKDMDFDILILQAQSGAIHIIAAGMTPTPERAEQILFTHPYTGRDPFVILTKHPFIVESIEDLQGKNVTVIQGYTAEKYMKSFKDIFLHRLISPSEAFLALSKGRADAYVTSLSSARPFLEQQEPGEFHIFYLEQGETSAFGISPRYKELLPEIQHILDEMEADGTLPALRKQWRINTEE